MGRVTNAIFETEKIKNNSSDGEELTKLLETRRSQIKGLPSVFFMLADGNNLNRGLGLMRLPGTMFMLEVSEVELTAS